MTIPAPAPSRSRRIYVYWGVCLAAVLLVALLGFTFGDALRRQYYRAMLGLEIGNPWYNLRGMAGTGPEGVEFVLRQCRGGSHDGDVEQIVGYILRKHARSDVYPLLLPYFQDPDPRVRGFAASVAGYLRDERYLPHLRKLLSDKGTVAGWFVGAVADRARTAIEWTERRNEDEGIGEFGKGAASSPF